MKKILLSSFLLSTFAIATAQQNLDQIIAAGVEDAQQFTMNYITPATEGLLWNTTSGWMQGTKVKAPLRFEISLMGSLTLVKDEQKSFNANTATYNNIVAFRSGETGPRMQSLDVATAFGENSPNAIAIIRVENQLGIEEEVEIELPQGLGSEGINFLPTAFLQGRIGLFKGAEFKVRYFPKIEYDDIKTGLIGVGFQYEVSRIFPKHEVLPFRISALAAYTNTTGEYDFTGTGQIDGDNQRFKLKQNSYNLQLMASTKLPIINFYGGVGYVTGTSDFDILGTYRFRDPTLLIGGSQTTIEDPISIENKISGVRATLGFKLQLGFFAFHGDYNVAEYNTATFGFHFGI